MTVPLQLPAALLDRLAQVIDETDEKAAAARVAEIRAADPSVTPEALVEQLIRRKMRDTAVVGATTSGLAIVPGLGTVASLTLGVAADFGITFKMQAELVLEIATAYGHTLLPEEKRRVVLLVTGLSAGTTAVAHRAGKQVSKRVTARVASKYVAKAVPLVGMAASASTNAVMTYMIGKRAQAYFSLEPEAWRDWGTGAAALTGIDRSRLVSGVRKGGDVMANVGRTAVRGAKQRARKAGSAIIRRRQKQKELPEVDDEQIIPIFDADN